MDFGCGSSKTACGVRFPMDLLYEGSVPGTLIRFPRLNDGNGSHQVRFLYLRLSVVNLMTD